LRALIEALVIKVVNDHVEATIDIEPDRVNINVSPWKPYEMRCPYAIGNKAD